MNDATTRAIVAIVIVVLLGGCGANAKHKTLRATFASIDATAAAFVVWDREEQSRIVQSARTYEEGQTALTKYRVKRQTIVHSLELAYRAVAVAALDATDTNLAAAARAAEQVYELLDSIQEPR